MRSGRLRLAAALAALAAVVAVPSALGTAAQEPRGGLWFVELASPPTTDGTSLATVKSEQAAFRAAAKKAGLQLRERHSYASLFNGLSIEATAAERAAIARLDGVKRVWPVLTVEIPKTAPADPDLTTAIAQTGADVAQSELGLSGEGIKVAVMDTGIDYDHASLGGDGTARSNSAAFPNSRVVDGVDLVGDAFNANPTDPAYSPTPVPDALPDDCQGHGTHVAGIVGASGDIKGVAPGVTFGSYRVFGCAGSTTADIMLAAMEAALADGMDILNMSIGSAFMTWPQYPTAAGSDRLVQKGMVVVASIGNSGADGVYSAGAPGVGRKVIGVASMDNSHVELRTFTAAPDGLSVGYQQMTGAPAAPTAGTAMLARTGTPTTANDACNPLAAGSLAGKVALIRRGTCTFRQKVQNAQTAGAVAAIVYNNASGRFAGTVAGATPPEITIPAVSISDSEGATLSGRLPTAFESTIEITWTDQVGKFPNATAGLASSFTSYGPTAELDVKPDVAAPGGLIRSTYPLEKGGSAVLSGTSMSSPHTAGAVALLLEARPDTSPEEARRILQNTADPARWSGNPGLGFPEPVHRQGAGMIDIPGAVLSTTQIEPSKLALGESQAGPQTRTLTLKNTSASDVTYNLGNVSAIGTGNTFPTLAFFLQSRTVEFSQAGVPVTSVTVPAGGSATVDVTINPTSNDKTVFGGFLTFTGGGQTYRVPYAGFVGDYQSLTILQAGAAGIFPALGRRTGVVSATDLTEVHTPVAAGAVFTMVGASDKPYVLAHFAHQVRKVRIELFNATTNDLVGLAATDEYRERNSRRTGTTNDTNGDVYMPFLIDGSVKKGNKVVTVPDGSYYAVLSVQKALGDDADPAHFETWTSPTFTIDRP